MNQTVVSHLLEEWSRKSHLTIFLSSLPLTCPHHLAETTAGTDKQMLPQLKAILHFLLSPQEPEVSPAKQEEIVLPFLLLAGILGLISNTDIFSGRSYDFWIVFQFPPWDRKQWDGAAQTELRCAALSRSVTIFSLSSSYPQGVILLDFS